MTDEKAPSVIYKYKWRALPILWTLVMTSLCLFLGFADIPREGALIGLSISLVSTLIVLAIAWTLFLSLSDIYIDGDEITRQALGLTWQRIRWSEAKRLTIVMSKNPEDGHVVRSFVVEALKGTVRFGSRRIAFQEREQEMAALLDALMSCVHRHNIKIDDMTVR